MWGRSWLLWIGPKEGSWRGKKKNQHKGLKVAAQQDTSVAAPRNIQASCKKFVVTSHGTFFPPFSANILTKSCSLASPAAPTTCSLQLPPLALSKLSQILCRWEQAAGILGRKHMSVCTSEWKMPRIQFPPVKIVQNTRAVLSWGAGGNHLKPCDSFDNSCSKINVLTALESLVVLSGFSYICSSIVVLQDIYPLGMLHFKQ